MWPNEIWADQPASTAVSLYRSRLLRELRPSPLIDVMRGHPAPDTEGLLNGAEQAAPVCTRDWGRCVVVDRHPVPADPTDGQAARQSGGIGLVVHRLLKRRPRE